MSRTTHPLARAGVAITTVAAAVAVAVLPVSPASAATAKTTKVHPVGAIPTGIKVPARLRASAFGVAPTSVDLRAGAPAVGDQGYVGSCVAWSIGYSLTGYYARSISDSGAPYAPLYLYMRTVQGTPGPNTGLYPPYALRNEQNEGIDTQADYWQGTTNVSAWPTAAQVSNAANYRITGWTTLFSGLQSGSTAQTVLKQSLAAGTPVSISIPVYSGFDGINSMTPYGSVSGAIRGYHMITAYGYDDQGLIIRNSWGKWWGSSGDAKLAWSFVNGQVNSAYTIAGVTAKGKVSPGAPAVTGLSTGKAAAGTTVTITGTGLASATKVMFGSVPAEFTNVTTDGGATALAAVAPAQALGTVDVTVTNAAGTSPVSAAGKFTYLPSLPTITALSPTTVSTLGGAAVAVTGTNLTGATGVKVGTTVVAARAVTATSLTFTAPAYAAGTVDLSIVTAGGTATTKLTYIAQPAPAITSLSPASGSTTGATPVVLTGTNFTGVKSVTVAGVPVGYTMTSPTTLSVTLLPRIAGPVAVVVTTTAGASSAATFTYVPPPAPTVTALSTKVVTTTGTTQVTVTGTSMIGTVTATVDGKVVPIGRLSDNQVRITTPMHAAGMVPVVITAAGGSSTPVMITYVAPVPTVRTLSPSTGPAVTGAVVTVWGVGFTGATKVTVGDAPVSYTVLSDTSLRITVPRTGAGNYQVKVTTVGGTGQSSTAYTARA
jgi:hypothetical protein